MSSLHDRIKQMRLERKMSQTDLAQSCGVSQPTVANWERGGHVPRQDALKNIARELRVDPIWLLSGQDPATANPINTYIRQPIHHIPVYDWPNSVEQFSQSAPVQFVSISTNHSDCFALLSAESQLSDFKEGTALIFSKKTPFADGGMFLVTRSNDIELTNNPGPDDISLGRLLYSITEH